MKFGVRECAEVVLRAKGRQQVGKRTFYRNEPVIRFDTLSTSSMEGAATTVYAQGGRGNARLLAWEGERTLTFTMEDALISPEGIMILAGAGLIDAASAQSVDRDGNVTGDILYVHTTSQVKVDKANTIILPKLACWSHSGEMGRADLAETSILPLDANGAAQTTPGKNYYNDGADIFIMVLKNGEVADEPCIPAENGVKYFSEVDPITKKTVYKTEITCYTHSGTGIAPGDIVLVDYYVKRTSGVKQIEITPDKFGGYYYLEASTLFRDEATGRDLPAEFIIPKCKVQSNFTFTLASSGDPSTFTFTLDAFPDYTKFDGTKKVLAVIQVVETGDDDEATDDERREHCKLNDGQGQETQNIWENNSHFDHYAQIDKYKEGYAYIGDDKASPDYRTKDWNGNDATRYTVSVGSLINGSITVAPTGQVAEGATVTLTITPDDSYKLDTLSVTSGGEDVTVESDNTFVMPGGNVTVTATFVDDE